MDNAEFAHHIVEVLNRAVRKDPQAMDWLFEYRVECNEGIVKDPTICARVKKGQAPSLGVLGLINGFVGQHQNGGGLIACEVKNNSNGGQHIARFFVNS